MARTAILIFIAVRKPPKFKWSTAELLKLGFAEHQGSAKGCQGFRQTRMRNGGRFLLSGLSFYVRIKIRVATLDADRSVTDSTQSFHRCFKTEASWCRSAVSQHLATDTRCVRRKEQVIAQFKVSRWYFTCNVHKDKQTLVFNFVFHLL